MGLVNVHAGEDRFGAVERRPCPPKADSPKGKAGAERAQFHPASAPFVATCGRLHRQPAVRTLVIVVLEVTGKPRVKRVSVGIIAQINILVFHAAPKSFDQHIVERTAPTIHADSHVQVEQRAGKTN